MAANYLPQDTLVFCSEARREWLLVGARRAGFWRAASIRARCSPTRADLCRRPSSGGAEPPSCIHRRWGAVQQHHRRPGPSSPTPIRAVLRRRPSSGGAEPPSCTNRRSDAVQQHHCRLRTPSTSSLRTSKSIRPLFSVTFLYLVLTSRTTIFHLNLKSK
jgi:hypothetical protein